MNVKNILIQVGSGQEKNEGKDIEFKLVDVDENFFEMMTEKWNRV